MLSGNEIFREKIDICLHTSDMQTQDKLLGNLIARKRYSLWFFVDHVGESDSTGLSHESVRKCACLKCESEVEHVAIDLDDIHSGVIIANPITSNCI